MNGAQFHFNMQSAEDIFREFFNGRDPFNDFFDDDDDFFGGQGLGQMGFFGNKKSKNKNRGMGGGMGMAMNNDPFGGGGFGMGFDNDDFFGGGGGGGFSGM